MPGALSVGALHAFLTVRILRQGTMPPPPEHCRLSQDFFEADSAKNDERKNEFSDDVAYHQCVWLSHL